MATELTCGKCGIAFSVPDAWLQNRKRDHESFWCPNGDCRHFPGESDIEKAKREAREAQARVNQEQHLRLVAEKQRDDAYRKRDRLERRVARGVCVCCNRTFGNLARHMKTKHAKEMLLPGSEKRIEGPIQ